MAKYIEKDAFLRQYGPCNPEVFEKPEHANGWNALLSVVETFSPADVEPVRHGRWLPPTIGKYGCVCSACKIQSDNDFNYCPECGAKMDLEEAK